MTVCGTLRHVSCEKSKPCADSSEGEWVGPAPHLDCTESFKFISRNLQTITRRFSEEQAKTPGVSDFLSVKCQVVEWSDPFPSHSPHPCSGGLDWRQGAVRPHCVKVILEALAGFRYAGNGMPEHCVRNFQESGKGSKTDSRSEHYQCDVAGVTKRHKLGALGRQKWLQSQSGRPEVQKQGVSRARVPLEALTEHLLPPAAPSWGSERLVACACLTPVSVSVFCMSVSHLPRPLSYKDTHDCIQAHPNNPG